MNDNRIELEQVVHTYRTLHQSGRPAERPVWCTKSQCSLLKIYFHIRWVPAYAVSYSFHLKTCSHCDEKWQKSIRYVMIHFSRSAAAQLRSLTEIAGKSPLFYVNWQKPREDKEGPFILSWRKQNPVLFSCRCKDFPVQCDWSWPSEFLRRHITYHIIPWLQFNVKNVSIGWIILQHCHSQ